MTAPDLFGEKKNKTVVKSEIHRARGIRDGKVFVCDKQSVLGLFEQIFLSNFHTFTRCTPPRNGKLTYKTAHEK
jgi:hypothetical protein